MAAAFLVTFSILDRLGPPTPDAPVRDGLLAWDGRWFQAIAADGYGDASDPALRFFPLWPLLGRALGGLTGIDEGLVLVVLANAGALAAGVLLHRLVVEETGDPGLARRAVRLLALAPPSFVLVLGYSEALYPHPGAGRVPLGPPPGLVGRGRGRVPGRADPARWGCC